MRKTNIRRETATPEFELWNRYRVSNGVMVSCRQGERKRRQRRGCGVLSVRVHRQPLGVLRRRGRRRAAAVGERRRLAHLLRRRRGARRRVRRRGRRAPAAAARGLAARVQRALRRSVRRRHLAPLHRLRQLAARRRPLHPGNIAQPFCPVCSQFYYSTLDTSRSGREIAQYLHIRLRFALHTYLIHVTPKTIIIVIVFRTCVP